MEAKKPPKQPTPCERCKGFREGRAKVTNPVFKRMLSVRSQREVSNLVQFSLAKPHFEQIDPVGKL